MEVKTKIINGLIPKGQKNKQTDNSVHKQIPVKNICILPRCTDISSIAQIALLQTNRNSGLRFWPKIGRKSPTI